MEAMAVLDRDGMYGAPRFYMAAKNMCIRALMGAEVTAEEGWRYPLLVESRAWISEYLPADHAHEDAREKGEGRISRAELAAAQLENGTEGLICLTGGDEGPAGARAGVGRHDRRDPVRAAALRAIWKAQRVCGIAAALFREEEVRNQRALEIARKLKSAGAGDQWRLPCIAGAARIAGCVFLRSPSPHAGDRGAPAGAQRRTPPEISRGNGTTFRGPSRSYRQYAGAGFAAAIYVERSGLSVSRFIRCRMADRKCNFCATARTTACSTAMERTTSARGSRSRTNWTMIEKLELAGYFLIVWDIIRFCARAKYSGAGARLGGQQRGVLCAGNYRGGSGGHGAAVRAIFIRRARRVAGHRSGFAQRRPARARHSICVRALWKVGRGHDRQRDYLSRALRGARNRESVCV